MGLKLEYNPHYPDDLMEETKQGTMNMGPNGE